MDEENIEPRLAKCPSCKSSFYVKTEGEKIRMICPICKKEVDLKLNGETNDGNLEKNRESSSSNV